MQQEGNRAFIVSHTKHHHHNYHDHNRKDGNDNHRHYYYHHHPGDLVQTILIGPLGCESRFLEWVNWKYLSNIGERANNIIHKQIWLLPYYAHPQLHDQEHHHHQWDGWVEWMLYPHSRDDFCNYSFVMYYFISTNAFCTFHNKKANLSFY